MREVALVEWMEQVEAAEHRLESARVASSALWRLRHMRAAMGLLADAVTDMGRELEEAEQRLPAAVGS